MFDAFDRLQITNAESLTLVNCAGKHGSVLEMQTNHFEYLTKNFLIDMNCLSLCADKGIPNAVLLSSITAFPVDGKEVFSEEDIFTGPVSSSIHGYAASKR
jgi:nucleoside-diphosphate-sugar epimerase